MIISLQNIDFMPTILSRFDMIFIVKDVHDQGKDMVCVVYVAQLSIWNIVHVSCTGSP